MTRLSFALLLSLALMGAVNAPAQEAKVYRVGVISPLPGNPEPPQVIEFRSALRQLGYVEGKNLVLVRRFAEGRLDLFPALVSELISLKVDVILAGSSPAVLAAKKATSRIPIVMAGLIDPVASGIVSSLARPGGNVTGSTFGVAGSGIAGKWLELLREAVPGIAHVAVLIVPTDAQTLALMEEMHAAARTLKMRIETFEVNSDAGMEKAFGAVAASGAEGLIVPTSPFFAARRGKVVKFAAERRLPAIYFFNMFPNDGGLMSYGGNVEESYRRAAGYVDRILKGAKPGELPIEQPTKFELVINLKAAKAIGVAIPQPLLLRADRVIE